MVGYKISNWSRATALVTADCMDKYRPCVREVFARGLRGEVGIGMISLNLGRVKMTCIVSLDPFTP